MGTMVAGLADSKHKINLNVDLHTRALITADIHQHLLHEGRFFRTAQQGTALGNGDSRSIVIDPSDHGDRVHTITTIWAVRNVRLEVFEAVTIVGGVQIPLLQTNRDSDYTPYSEIYIDAPPTYPMSFTGGWQTLDIPLNLAVCNKGIAAEFFLKDHQNFYLRVTSESFQPNDIFIDMVVYEHEHYVPPGT